MGQTVHTLVNWTKIVYKQFFLKKNLLWIQIAVVIIHWYEEERVTGSGYL